MIYVLLAIVIIALIVGPGLWVKRILKTHNKPRTDLPGTGGELARHLMNKHNMTEVSLEQTDGGDHYDPISKTIRLSDSVMNDKSLTAVAVSAHEFGHALQHQKHYRPLNTRTLLVKNAATIQKLASFAVILIPIMAAFPPLAPFSRLILIFVVGALFLATIVHLVTLPVEFDASFGRALPILKEGAYVNQDDLKTIRTILWACALTYVSQALMSAVNIGRWMTIFRR